ncbi:hypothetical protein S245_022683, partial [Arachis hypogaea]
LDLLSGWVYSLYLTFATFLYLTFATLLLRKVQSITCKGILALCTNLASPKPRGMWLIIIAIEISSAFWW